MTVYYEWDVEEIATENHVSVGGQEYDAGDVMEHFHQTSLKDCHQFIEYNSKLKDDLSRFQIVLVRDGERSRTWAYMEYGKLPEFFVGAWGEDRTRVPKRFHEEVKRIQNNS